MGQIKNSDLVKILNKHNDKPIYVQVGFNRFDIEVITEDEDTILLIVAEDANNPKDKRIA